MQEMKIKIGNREYTLNNNSGKYDRAKKDAGGNATPEQILAHYDKLAGLIKNENGNKIENGSFWEAEKKRIADEPRQLKNKTDEEPREIMRNSIDNQYVPSSIYHKAKQELEFRNMSGKKDDEILKLSPEFYGIGVNLRSLWKKIKSWFDDKKSPSRQQIVGQKKIKMEKKSWHETWWGVLVIGIFVTVVGGFILSRLNFNQELAVKENQNILVSNESFSEGQATSTLNISDLFDKALKLETVLERQYFLEKYIGEKVIGNGIVDEVSKSGLEEYFIDIRISGRTLVVCPIKKTAENEKKILFLKGKKMNFSGIFTYQQIFGHEGLKIDECNLLNL